MYLACACAHDARGAISAFEQHFLVRVGSFLSKMKPTQAFVEDVTQELRIKLLVSKPGAARKIADYSGRGALMGWLRVVALRTAIDLQRRNGPTPEPRPHGTDDSDREATPAVGAARDPELTYLKDQYETEFNAAFRAALDALSSEQRNVLRLHFVDGLNIDQIGALLHIHRSTAARWIAAARVAILREVQRLLRERLDLSVGEFESLARLLQSRIDMTLSGLFQEG
jgi:RNA polymerase sigma-70 factor (ECF subfamily)